jgi:hypothetical protein
MWECFSNNINELKLIWLINQSPEQNATLPINGILHAAGIKYYAVPSMTTVLGSLIPHPSKTWIFLRLFCLLTPFSGSELQVISAVSQCGRHLAVLGD